MTSFSKFVNIWQMKKIKCPHCGKEAEYSKENKSRPFCSERCQLIDLGDWANEEHKISEPLDQGVEVEDEGEQGSPYIH